MSFNKEVFSRAEDAVRKCQNDITRAAEGNIHSAEVIQLQKALIRSDEGKLVAIKAVLTNKGKNTPGPDGIIFKVKDLENIMKQLKNVRTYRCGGVRRVFIPKGNNKVRPLGIPNMIDRI